MRMEREREREMQLLDVVWEGGCVWKGRRSALTSEQPTSPKNGSGQPGRSLDYRYLYHTHIYSRAHTHIRTCTRTHRRVVNRFTLTVTPIANASLPACRARVHTRQRCLRIQSFVPQISSPLVSGLNAV